MRAEILVGPERRRRWSVEEKLEIVREAAAPGVRVADVARRRDVARAQVYQWRAALREGRLAGPGAGVVGFVEIGAPATPDAPPPTDPGQPVEISLAGGRSLKVWSSLPAAELRRLIRAVEGA